MFVQSPITYSTRVLCFLLPRCGLKTEEPSFVSKLSNNKVLRVNQNLLWRANHPHHPCNKHQTQQNHLYKHRLHNSSTASPLVPVRLGITNITFKIWQISRDRLIIKKWSTVAAVSIPSRPPVLHLLRLNHTSMEIINLIFLTCPMVVWCPVKYRGTEWSLRLWCVKTRVENNQQPLNFCRNYINIEVRRLASSETFFFSRNYRPSFLTTTEGICIKRESRFQKGVRTPTWQTHILI